MILLVEYNKMERGIELNTHNKRECFPMHTEGIYYLVHKTEKHKNKEKYEIQKD